MGAEQDPARAEIARLVEVAGREDDKMQHLDGCVAELHEALAAKTALHRITAAELRAALEHRRQTLGGGQP
jgi:hypothetical protein